MRENITRHVAPCKSCKTPTTSFDGYCDSCQPPEYDKEAEQLVQETHDIQADAE